MTAATPHTPMVVGLTGGIGSGKTAAADAFAVRGVAVTDTDRIAHAVTAPGAAGWHAIREAFGPAVFAPDGALDRTALRRRVFGDPAERDRLEALLHPLIADAARREIAGWRSPYGLLVVPLLLERGGLRALVRRVLVVDCAEELQIARVMARSGMTRREVEAIMAAQASRSARLAAADDVIDNSGSLEALRAQIADLDARYLALAAPGSAGSAGAENNGAENDGTDARRDAQG
jgi:dephospho-CoA kinase